MALYTARLPRLATQLLCAAVCASGAWAQPQRWPTPAMYGPSPSFTDASSLMAPPAYTSGSAALRASIAAGSAALSNITLRVGVAVNFLPPALGADNLVRFVSTSAPGYIAWCNATPGTAVRISPSDVTGQMVWVMNYLAAYGPLAGLEWYAVSLPTSIATAQDSTFKALWIMNILGLDTPLYGITVTPQRQQYIAFTQPFTFYSHQLVAQRATLPRKSVTETLWQFTAPFSWDMWLAFIGMLFLQSLTYFRYERSSEVRNMMHQESARSTARAYSYAAFLVTMSVVGTNNHVPTSISGRVYTAMAAFCVWIIMASYISNLASLLSSRPTPLQAVTGFDMFAQQPLCVRNNSIQLHFLQTQFPSVQYLITGLTTQSMFDAVLAGTCAGGIEDELLLRYLLGAGDPTGEYCGIDTIGPPTAGAYPFALAFPLNSTYVTRQQVDAISMAIAASLYNGNYSAAETVYLPQTRSMAQCQSYLASKVSTAESGVQPLTATDMAGVFLIAIMAVVITTLGRECKSRVKRSSIVERLSATLATRPAAAKRQFAVRAEEVKSEAAAADEEQSVHFSVSARLGAAEPETHAAGK